MPCSHASGAMGGPCCLSLCFMLLLFIPAFQALILQDYGFVVGNGNKLMFFKDALTETVNLPILESSRSVKPRVVSVVPDKNAQVIYFSYKTKNTSSIGVFSLATNQSVHLLTGSKESIGSLNLYKDHLYWCNETNKSVMRLAANDWMSENKSVVSSPEHVFSDPSATFESVTVHPTTGLIYYTKWRRSNESEILVYDPSTKIISTEVSNIYQPKGLYIDDKEEYLYWLDNPPGIYYHIERVRFNDKKRDLLIRGQNQHPYNIIANCSTLYWTDVLNNGLWKFSIQDRTPTYVKKFTNGVPYSVAATNTAPCSGSFSDNEYYSAESTTMEPILPANFITDPASRISQDSHTLASAPFYSPIANLRWCNSLESTRCQNNATCIVVNQVVRCLCAEDFGGKDCQTSISVYHSLSSNQPLVASSLVFSVVVIILFFIILYMGIKYRKKEPMPRIRRRVVVSHRSDLDVTPGAGSSSVCEMIDIENCCNMNICETPCYERLGSFSTGSSNGGTNKSRISVKEDKTCLLSGS